MEHDKGVAEQKDAVCNLFATFKCSLDNLEHCIRIVSKLTPLEKYIHY